MSQITTRGHALHGEVEGTAVGLLATDFTIFAQFLQSASAIASAGTITLPDYREYYRVTGTTTITSISTTNVQAGKSIYLMFTSPLLLRHNAGPGGATFPFFLAAGQDITVGGAGSPLILEFKFDSVAVAMVQVGGATSSALAAGVYGDSNYYVASLTLNAAGEVQAILLRNFADNKATGNTGNIVMTQAAPSGPFTNDRLRFDGGEGLIVQDRVQGFYDLSSGITVTSNGLFMPHANEGAIVLGTSGAANVDGIAYTNWEYGSQVTVRIFANVNPVTIRHLASAPLNCRAFYLTGTTDIVIAAGTSLALTFMLDQQTGPIGGNPVWAQVGQATGAGGGGVASVTAGTGISITGTGTNPIVNNTGVLSVSAGTNVTITGTAQNPIVNSTGGGGGGITQLTGDVTAGPGSGSVAATNVNAPSGFTHAGSVITSAIGAPSTPAAGTAVQWVDATSKNFCSKSDNGAVNHGIRTFGPTTSNWLSAVSDSGVPTLSRPAFTDITGTLGSGQFGPLTGDVTTTGYAATLVNIPSDTPMAGDLLATAMAAPGAPVAGKGRIYFDSTSLNLAAKSAGGIVNHGIQTRAATANNWIRSIADDGSTTISQPAFTDISGSITLSQLGNGGALSVLGQPANASGIRSDIAASAGSGAALRESGSTIGWGTLATAAYGAATVTYPKIQNVTGNSLLGRGNGGGGQVQELSVSGPGAFTASTLVIKKQYSLTWGGIYGSLGTQLASTSVYLGIGGFPQYLTSFFGFRVPNDSTLQDWAWDNFQNTFSGTGSPTYLVQVVLNGTPVFTLYTGTAGVTSGGTAQSTQVVAAGDILGIRVSVNTGTINSGNFGIYVVGRCQE